jgi:hypothetical protein
MCGAARTPKRERTEVGIEVFASFFKKKRFLTFYTRKRFFFEKKNQKTFAPIRFSARA